jgi:hypothetical protein
MLGGPGYLLPGSARSSGTTGSEASLDEGRIASCRCAEPPRPGQQVARATRRNSRRGVCAMLENASAQFYESNRVMEMEPAAFILTFSSFIFRR